jgi:tetratricopeptide (TPR) repeat protein
VQQPDHEKTVYFVQGLQWGGGEDGRNAYRALNIRREYFVDYRLRFILWLTEKEAYYLPRYAPDFWAFRHRVVEFFDFPDEDQIKKHGLDLIFRDMDDESMFDQDIDAKIGYRKRLLAQLSEKPETIVDRAGLLVILGVLYTVKDEYEMALRSYAEAMELTKQLEAIELESVKLTRLSDSNNHFQSLIYSFQGFVYAGLGQYEKALDDLNRAIQLDPNRAPAYNRRGNIYQKLGQYEQALADYKRAIQLNPEDITSYNNRGNIYANLGQYEKALADYERVVHLNPDDAITYNNRGTTYHDMGQYEQAIADFNEAIRLNPDYASAYNNRGNAYAILGQYEQAIVNYQQANELDSNWVVPIKRLGDVYAEIGDYAAAVSKYKQAIQVDPLFDNVYYDLALIYRTQAKYNEAIEACLKVIENDPEHVHALNGLGYLYIQMDDLKEAERYLDMSIKLSENS